MSTPNPDDTLQSYVDWRTSDRRRSDPNFYYSDEDLVQQAKLEYARWLLHKQPAGPLHDLLDLILELVEERL